MSAGLKTRITLALIILTSLFLLTSCGSFDSIQIKFENLGEVFSGVKNSLAGIGNSIRDMFSNFKVY
jgi:hypothetical protein